MSNVSGKTSLWQRMPVITRVGLIGSAAFAIVGLATSGLAGMLINIGLVAFFTAMFSLATGRKSWLRISSGKVGAVLLASAVLFCGLGSAATASSQRPQVAAFTEATSEATATATPSPTPTVVKPVVTTKNETTTEAIPFEATTVDDATLAAGTATITTPGVPGTRTVIYRVTFTDGVETSRVIVSDTTTPPVAQVTTNGTYVAPPAPVPFAGGGGGGGCDPNYSGPCVPIASDVDCAGGSGNGPAYTSGPVYVIGSDIYDLDRDGDGVGCD